MAFLFIFVSENEFSKRNNRGCFHCISCRSTRYDRSMVLAWSLTRDIVSGNAAKVIVLCFCSGL